MALLHPLDLFRAHPLSGAVATPFARMRSFTEEPEVVENDEGYLFSANVPGVKAVDLDVKVSAAHGAQTAFLSVKGPDVDLTFRVPAKRVDLSNVTASCIHGVLHVAVPKTSVAEHPIAVAEAPPGLRPRANNEITLRVPGFAPSDINIAVKSTGDLVVHGTSGCNGSFRQKYSLDKGVTPDCVSAACADGLLTISVAPSADDAERTVPITATGSADASPDRIPLMRHSIPGIGAGDLSASVKDGIVRVSGNHVDYASGRRSVRRVAYQTSLPAGADPASVTASCEHGVLAVTCAAPPAAPEVEVHVSGCRPARLGNDC